MPNRLVMRVTDELLIMAGTLLDVDTSEGLDDLKFIIMTVVSPVEYSVKLLTEDQMLVEYQNDPDILIMY